MKALVCGADDTYGAEAVSRLSDAGVEVVTCQRVLVNPEHYLTIPCDFRDESDIANATAQFVNGEHKFDLVVWASQFREDAPFNVMSSFRIQDHVMFNAIAPFILGKYLTRFEVVREGRMIVVLNQPQPSRTNIPYFVSMTTLQALARASGDFFDDRLKVIGLNPPNLRHPQFGSRFRQVFEAAQQPELLTGQVVS